MAILQEGHNCWRISPAERAAFLIDGAAYFETLAEAMEQAQNTICIAAWDFDSRIRLFRNDQTAPDRQKDLGGFLNGKTKRTPGLRVYILNWDFPMLYVREREWLPIFNLGWKPRPRLQYHLDDQHPIGASQHQKFVVIDDRIAFCGGMDLTNSRWDTPRHDLEEPRRKNPAGKPYGPFHDIQMIVEGDAAATMGDLFRNRWRWATGRRIEADRSESASPWPENLTPDLRNVQVAVSRTLPAYKGREEVRELEKLYTESIAAARKTLYIENQYLTSVKIAEAIADSLSRERGPEIVIVLPKASSGWLEQSTMDALRAGILENVFKADRHHRLQVFYPALPEKASSVYVHSKLMIVDDRLALIGSANLSNRSMGFDSECNLAVEAEDDPRAGKAIDNLRNRLLAEHLGVSVDTAADAFSNQTSLIQAIESLSAASGRRLEKLEYKQSSSFDGAAVVQKHEYLDPETPIEFDRMMDHFVRDENGPNKKRRRLILAGILILLLALAAAWRWTPLSEWIDRDTMLRLAGEIRNHPWSFPMVLAGFVAGGIIMIPVSLLVGVTAITYAPVRGALYAWSGCVLSALITFLVGAGMKKQTVRNLAGKRLNRLSLKMANQGVWAIAIIRNIPVAPFTIVNLVAGASHIKLRDFLMGTALGMMPGILAITVFSDRVLHTLRNPSWTTGLMTAALAVILALGYRWASRRLAGNRLKEDGPKE
jgi:phospholipase D1/2